MDIQMQKEHSASSVETKGTEESMFDAVLRTNTMQMPSLFVRCENGVQTMNIGTVMLYRL